MLQIELTIKADPGLLSALAAFGNNLENVALAIDSSMRIRQHEANQAELYQVRPVADGRVAYQHQSAPATQPPAPVAPVQMPPAVPASAVVPFPQQQTFTPPPAAPAAPVAAPVAAAPQYTHEMLGVAGAGLVDAGKQPELIALLGRFGVQAITQLSREALGAFATELRAMGARL